MKKRTKKKTQHMDELPIFKSVPTVLPDGFSLYKNDMGIAILNFLVLRHPAGAFEVSASYALPNEMLPDLIRDLTRLNDLKTGE